MLRAIVFLFLLVFSQNAMGKSINNKCPKNCYPMLIMRVIDSDTVQGYIHTNDDTSVVYAGLRLEGIDTPEISRAACLEEKLHGYMAKDYLEKELSSIIRSRSINRVCACDATSKKFAKRRVGELRIKRASSSRYSNLAKSLLKKCYAARYDGKKKPNWCNCLKNGNCDKQSFLKSCQTRFQKK